MSKKSSEEVAMLTKIEKEKESSHQQLKINQAQHKLDHFE